MRRHAVTVTLIVSCGLAALAALTLSPRADAFPEPLIVSNTWEYRFKHQKIEPIAVRNLRGDYDWYWFMLYEVHNSTGQERMFAPEIQVATDQGDLVNANKGIPPSVFKAIKARTGNNLLEGPIEVNGRFLQGDDNVKESVAIWRAFPHEVRELNIFVAGVSGETQRLTPGRTLTVTDKRKGEATYEGPLVTETHRRAVPRGIGRKLPAADLYIDNLKKIDTPTHTDEGTAGSSVTIQNNDDAWIVTYDDADHTLVVTQRKDGLDQVLRKQLMIKYELPGKPATPQDQVVIPRGTEWVIR